MAGNGAALGVDGVLGNATRAAVRELEVCCKEAQAGFGELAAGRLTRPGTGVTVRLHRAAQGH
jgi:hypothetical protein